MNSFYVNNWFSAEKTDSGFVFSMKAAGRKNVYHKCFLTKDMVKMFSKWCDSQIEAPEAETEYPEKWDREVLEKKHEAFLNKITKE